MNHSLAHERSVLLWIVHVYGTFGDEKGLALELCFVRASRHLAFLFGSGENASSGSGTPILADAARAQTRGCTQASCSSRVSSSEERGAHAAASFSRSSRLSVWKKDKREQTPRRRVIIGGEPERLSQHFVCDIDTEGFAAGWEVKGG